jgi:hypothetical protein
MKRLLSLVILFYLTMVVFNAHSQQSASRDSIIFEKIVHDYGTIERGSDGNCEFRFTNKGEKPLILTNVRASCGCTAPIWPREPILPGDSGVIKVGYNTNLMGGFSKVIAVFSNASNNQVTLTVRGNVVAKQE